MVAPTQPTSKRRAPATRPAARAPRTKPKDKPTYPEFIGEWPRLTGRQEPEFESRHEGDESEGDRCAQFGANLAATYGTKTRFMPWEWQTARGILSLQPPNEYGERLFTHRDVLIECTRQQGKTLIVVLLILFHLFVAPALGRAQAYKIVYTAQRWSTAKDVFNRVVKVINRVPWLKRRLHSNPSVRDNHGIIEVVTERDEFGAVIGTAVCEFAPRSQEFGRGVTELDVLFLDEAYDIDPGIENDLTGAQSASENPQTIYLSTPPVFQKHPKCHSLADLHRLGKKRAPLLFFQLFAAPKHLKRDDPAAWRAAQPSFDVATNEREIWAKLQKARNAVKRAIFDADYLGWGEYPPPEVDENSEIDSEKWADMGVAARKVRGEPALQLIGSPVLVIEREGNGPWAIIAAWRTTAPTAHIEVGYCEDAAPASVAAKVVTVVGAWDPDATVIRSGSAAAALIPDLEKAGVEVETINRPDVGQACAGLLNGVKGNQFSHSDQPEVTDAVAAAVKKEFPSGGFIWELEDEASYPVLMGISLAPWALTKFGKPPKKAAPMPAHSSLPPAASRQREAEWGNAGAFDPMTASF